MHLHILGICGTLMGSIALLAKEKGLTVSGSDENVYPPMSTQLENAGISLHSPYSAENIPADVDLVMIGNAGLPRGNPAVEHVLAKQIPYVSGAEWLGRDLLQDRWVIAVAGTHGKTTTTSMVAWILEYANLQPGFLVGGVPGNFGQSARLGDSPFFVIEADEYDTSYFDRRSKFVHYRPRTLIINNLEFDHADIFPDLAAIQAQFHLLLRTVPNNGQVIYPLQDDNVKATLEQGCWSETLPIGDHSELQAIPIAADNSEFEVHLSGEFVGKVAWSMTGEHNQNNALAAIAAARHVGVPPTVSCQALCEFKGVKRRMEEIFADARVTVYDDFAHHPTAIRSTLTGLRNKVGGEKILAVIEPGSHTMRKGTHAEVLQTATGPADHVLWFQPDNIGWDMAKSIQASNQDIVSSHPLLLEKTLEAINNLHYKHVVIMSNGGFAGFHQSLVAALEQSSSP